MTGTFSACVTSGGLYRALALGVLGVDLNELREVATVAQCGRNRAQVGLKSIGADLEALAAGSVAQTLNKRIRGGLTATA
jgi:hypothetical protein